MKPDRALHEALGRVLSLSAIDVESSAAADVIDEVVAGKDARQSEKRKEGLVEEA